MRRFFGGVSWTFWTKLVRASCIASNLTRVRAFERLLAGVSFKYPSYGLATSRKFSVGTWSWGPPNFWVSKRAQNEVKMMYIEFWTKFIEKCALFIIFWSVLGKNGNGLSCDTVFGCQIDCKEYISSTFENSRSATLSLRSLFWLQCELNIHENLYMLGVCNYP